MPVLKALFDAEIRRFRPPISRDLARFSWIWPDFVISGPPWPGNPRFGPSGLGGSQFREIRAPGARSGQIPGPGGPNWHKSGGGGISCIRSFWSLSPGTYRSRILADSGISGPGTPNSGKFREFSAEMDHFLGGRF